MNIYILNTLEVGLNSTNILKRHLDIKGMIGLSDRNTPDKISGFAYLKTYCEKNNIGFVEVDDYSLKSASDRAKIEYLEIDILIVAGWQRLIPGWLINHCKICAIGSHGSVYGITGGRGRSPQNWALMLGKKEFFISIFKIDEGIDSGAIIDTQKYELSEFDDIKSSYYKVSWLTSKMIIKNIKNGNVLIRAGKKQSGDARYLPQRQPAEGELDWHRKTVEIYNFIRALTHPYPGAFSFFEKKKMMVWKARPFAVVHELNDYSPGELVNVYENGDLLIKTADAFLLVDEYEIDGQRERIQHEDIGKIFSSASFKKQIKTIVNRHYSKYPDLKITEDLTGLI